MSGCRDGRSFTSTTRSILRHPSTVVTVRLQSITFVLTNSCLSPESYPSSGTDNRRISSPAEAATAPTSRRCQQSPRHGLRPRPHHRLPPSPPPSERRFCRGGANASFWAQALCCNGCVHDARAHGTHSHSLAHARARTHTHLRSHALALTHACALTRSLSLALTRARALTHIIRALSRSCSHALMISLSHRSLARFRAVTIGTDTPTACPSTASTTPALSCACAHGTSTTAPTAQHSKIGADAPTACPHRHCSWWDRRAHARPPQQQQQRPRRLRSSGTDAHACARSYSHFSESVSSSLAKAATARPLVEQLVRCSPRHLRLPRPSATGSLVGVSPTLFFAIGAKFEH